MRPTKLRLDALEDRSLLSTIHWVNDGVNDHFGEVWGAQADEARAVVRAAIDAWERVIVNFNNDNNNTLDLTVRMATDQDVADYGFGGNTDRTAGQCPPSGIELDDDGRPVSALILLGRGGDGQGSGYFVDSSPDDHSEFTGTIVNAFAGQASAPAASGKMDFYTLTLAELTHAIGITSASGSRYRDLVDAGAAGIGGVKLVDTGITDKNYVGADDPEPTLWVFDGPSINYLMTDADGGNKGKPSHAAAPDAGNQNVFVYGTGVLRGNWNAGNASLPGGRRNLVPNALALMLKDVYGYTLNTGGPERFGTFYALNHGSGELQVRGSAAADELTIDRVASTRVEATIGQPVGGTAPFAPGSSTFVSVFPNGDVDSIQVNAGAGNDEVVFTGAYAGVSQIQAEGEAGRDLLSASAISHNVTLRGGTENDTLRGGGGHDVLTAGTGNDLVNGNGGDDYILGDLGNDFLQGNAGDDTIAGGSGNDRIVGGTQVANYVQNIPDGADQLDGEDGHDTVFGDNAFHQSPTPFGGGNDLVLGGIGNDLMYGGLGNDTVRGEAGRDALFGLWGNDTLEGGTGNDTLRGFDGDDRLDGQEDADLVYGEDGEDDLIGGLGADTLRGGSEDDLLVGGTLFEDVFDASPDVLYGESGNDAMYGDNVAFAPGNVGGNDVMDGGTGNDSLFGQAGNDQMTGGHGDDDLTGGDGDDRLIGGVRTLLPNVQFEVGADRLDGGDGDDVIVGDSGSAVPLMAVSPLGGDDTILGGDGADTLYGMRGDDLIDGGDDDDQAYGQDGNDTITGGGGDDRLSGNQGSDSVVGGTGEDNITGDDGNDVLYGGDGDDVVRGGTGRDFLTGDADNDVLLGGADGDALLGGDGRDVLIGGGGADGFSGGLGDDLLVNGWTTFDAADASLGAIRAEWTSARTYQQRVLNLRGINNPTFGARLNGNRFLKTGGSVFNDGMVDQMNGEADADWYFRGPGDLLDAVAVEVVL